MHGALDMRAVRGGKSRTDENEVRLQDCTVRKRSKISPRGCHYSSWTQIVLSETGRRGEGIHHTAHIYQRAISVNITVERESEASTVMARIAGLVVLLVASAAALPQPEPQPDARSLYSKNSIQTENDLLMSIYNDCLQKDSASCMKVKFLSFIDKWFGHQGQKDTFTIAEGVTVVKTANEPADGAPRASTDDSIESVVFNRVQRFLQTHTIKIDLEGSKILNAVTSTGRALNDVVDNLTEDDSLEEEGRGKKKKAQKLLGPLMAALAMKAAALIPLALGAIALLAGKALIVGKIALVLSAILGLKKLLSGGHGKHVTYEVVSHPHHSSSHVSTHEASFGGGYGGGDAGGGYGGSSGHGGWGRSLDAQQLAYSAHAPQ